MMFLTVQNLPENYTPVLIQLAVGLGFVIFTLIASQFLGPKLKGKQKDNAFECGIDSVGDARSPFSIKYFMTAILFVLFDIEIVFFYPYAVNFKDFGTTEALNAFLSVTLFVSVFLIGFIYVRKRGALDWEK